MRHKTIDINLRTATDQIEEKISKSSRGKLFFADDFVKFGTPDNIRQVLSRLEKDDVLLRIAQGIYLKPKIDPLIGSILPDIEEVAKEIAQRDKVRIAPTGVLALYLLGLSTQVPLKAVYLTDGSQREVQIGKRTIKFKKTVPKSFAIKDELLHLVVQAFREVGKKNITDAFLNQIKPSVLKLDEDSVKQQLKYAAEWIQKAIIHLYNSKNNVDRS